MTLVDYALLAELAYFDTDDTQVPLQQVLMYTSYFMTNMHMHTIYCTGYTVLVKLSPVLVAHTAHHTVAV
jgi:hypothetical protein